MRLILGECLEKLREMEDNSVDSVVTDAPYGLSFMGKKWDYDVPSTEIWKECLRVLKPGGHLLCFASSRTYHRMAVNIEDAGFEIRDQLMWIYGSGFPKSHNIGKAVDKNGGNGHLVYEVAKKLKEARESRGITKTEADKLFCNGSTNYSWLEGRKNGVRLPEDDLFQKIVDEWSELKPYQEKVKSANREIVGKYDSDMGGLGGERLGSKGGDITLPATSIAQQYEGWGTALKPAHEPIVMARKPLSEKTIANNVLEWGTGGINIDESRVETQDNLNGGAYGGNNVGVATYALSDGRKTLPTNKLTKGDFIQPEGRFPANILLSEEAAENLDQHTDNTSRYFYVAKPSKKEKTKGLDKNVHPTVKPIKLMEYLIKMVTPVGGTTLDPFMGSGSTGISALTNGFDFIGIEREQEYMEIARQRIEVWTKEYQTKLDI